MAPLEVLGELIEEETANTRGSAYVRQEHVTFLGIRFRIFEDRKVHEIQQDTTGWIWRLTWAYRRSSTTSQQTRVTNPWSISNALIHLVACCCIVTVLLALPGLRKMLTHQKLANKKLYTGFYINSYKKKLLYSMRLQDSTILPFLKWRIIDRSQINFRSPRAVERHTGVITSAIL